MFTGLVEELGTVEDFRREYDRVTVVIRGEKVLEGTQAGDSIATDGVCLTVTGLEEGRFLANVMVTTLEKSALGALSPGDLVHLERAAALGNPMGGHIVQGHVDTVGRVGSIVKRPNGYHLTVNYPREYDGLVVDQGSIALMGVSLTVDVALNGGCTVSLIPETLRSTKLGALSPGDPVNIEFDIIGKYVARQWALEAGGGSSLTWEKLQEAGF
ncbi:MAG: riboflavin synthase [Tissierellia bacterium]|nr:riboflavin synthase [Tissierellia bacterium]